MSAELEREFTGNHIKEIFNKLNSDRIEEKRFCDVTIGADSTEFSAHKPVLVLFCKFFEKLFMSEMKEKYSSSGNIQGVDGNIMEIILSYIYTEKILITKENVYDVLAAADYMQIPALLKFCGEFLDDILDLSNCIDIFAYLRMYNQIEWTENPTRLISENFESLAKLHRFRSMRFDDFQFVLQLKNRKYSSEKVVYEAVIDWINDDIDQRKAYLSQLFQCIDLHKFSGDFLKEVLMEEKLIVNSLECMQAITTMLVEMKFTDAHSPQSTSSQSQKEEVRQRQNKSPKKQNEPRKNKKATLFDQYEYEDFNDVEVSKELVRILRHGKYREIQLDRYGYCFLDDITHCKRFLDRFGKLEHGDISEIVNYGDRKRFELKLENGRCKIRATYKHSVEVEDEGFVEILDAGNCEIYHGTTYEEWDLIKYDGLGRSRDKYIHFTKGMNQHRMRKYDIVIKLNMEMAIQDGLKFYVEPQGGVVCKGDGRGKIAPRFFSFVKELETNKRLHYRMPRDYGEI